MNCQLLPRIDHSRIGLSFCVEGSTIYPDSEVTAATSGHCGLRLLPGSQFDGGEPTKKKALIRRLEPTGLIPVFRVEHLLHVMADAPMECDRLLRGLMQKPLAEFPADEALGKESQYFSLIHGS